MALVTSGPAAACAWAPAEKAALRAEKSADVAAVADACLVRSRRLGRRARAGDAARLSSLLVAMIAPGLLARVVNNEAAGWPAIRRSLLWSAPLRGSGIGPRHRHTLLRCPGYKFCANSLAPLILADING
jgi:hypothetical protein